VCDTRYEWAYLFGAVCPERAVGVGIVMPYANTKAMNKHLQEIGKAVAPGAHAALVLDGAGWHDSADLVMPDNITPMVLPPYSPELNPVENIWEYLRKNKLANRLYDTAKISWMPAAMLGTRSWPCQIPSPPSPDVNGQKCHEFVGWYYT